MKGLISERWCWLLSADTCIERKCYVKSKVWYRFSQITQLNKSKLFQIQSIANHNWKYPSSFDPSRNQNERDSSMQRHLHLFVYTIAYSTCTRVSNNLRATVRFRSWFQAALWDAKERLHVVGMKLGPTRVRTARYESLATRSCLLISASHLNERVELLPKWIWNGTNEGSRL